MFSNDINARDLYFSNPIDHFFAQDQEIKTSFESGFSSSINQTGNSRELQYKSSQDLFSQSRSQDLFSQNDRTNSQFEARNLDYQRYISQNLLLGKESPKSILSSRNRDKETRKEKEESEPFQKDCDENNSKEIKTSLETLNDSVKKLNSEICLQNGNVQEELSRIKEKTSFWEKTVGQNVELIVDSYRKFGDMIKKEENDKKQLYAKISEITENIKSLETKVEYYKEKNEKILAENIKKISKIYEDKHKKQLQKLQDQYSHFEKATQKRYSEVEFAIQSLEEKIENSLDQKFDTMKDYLKETIDKLVQLPGLQGNDSLPSKQNHLKSINDLTQDGFELARYKKPMTISDYDSGYNYQNPNTGRRGNAKGSPVKTTHTPLLHFFNKYENNEEPAQTYHLRPRAKPEVSSYNNSVNYTNLRIKRKVSTPIGKTLSPLFKKPLLPTKKLHCTPLITNFTRNEPYNEAFFHRNENDFSKRKYEEISNRAERTMISSSSPALTVYEAATIAKRMYAFHSHQMYRK